MYRSFYCMTYRFLSNFFTIKIRLTPSFIMFCNYMKSLRLVFIIREMEFTSGSMINLRNHQYLSKLTPNWHKTNFIGFALWAIVAFEDYSFKCESTGLQCEFYFKTSYEENRKFLCNFQHSGIFELGNKVKILSSKHMFMSYQYQDYRD